MRTTVPPDGTTLGSPSLCASLYERKSAIEASSAVQLITHSRFHTSLRTSVFFGDESQGRMNQFVPQLILGSALDGSSGPPEYKPHYGEHPTWSFGVSPPPTHLPYTRSKLDATIVSLPCRPFR